MLSERLRQIRAARKINQEEVAQYLGVKRQTYSSYERAVSVPDSLTLKKLADYFEVSVDDFFDPRDKDELENEQQLLMLARKAKDIPAEQRNRILKNFEDNINLYLDAISLGGQGGKDD